MYLLPFNYFSNNLIVNFLNLTIVFFYKTSFFVVYSLQDILINYYFWEIELLVVFLYLLFSLIIHMKTFVVSPCSSFALLFTCCWC